MEGAISSRAEPELAWSLWNGKTYVPRQPEKTPLFKVVRENLETFLHEAEQRSPLGNSVPEFVVEEFKKFLSCGALAGGFARLKCETCGHEKLVPFSCKGRGLCPSCAGRRMTEIAIDQVENIIPVVPVRQWVLSLPFRLRYTMAWNRELTLKVHRIFWRCLDKHYRKKAEGMGIPDGKTGGITVIQRAGDALNLNPHFHHSVLDGVFTEERAGKLRFHRVNAPTNDEVKDVTRDIRKRTFRMLGVKRLGPEDGQMEDDPLAEEWPALAAASAASVQSLVAFGERSGRRVLYAGEMLDPEELEQSRPKRKRHARINGFDLHAGAAVPAIDRVKLEKLQRYLLRPPVPFNRLKELSDGRYSLKLKKAWRDGTSQVIFEPLELMEKLAAIVPRPKSNQIIYSGVLAPNHRWRKRVVVYGREPQASTAAEEQESSERDKTPCRYIEWADLLKRTFDVDALQCPKCFGRMKLIAMIEQPDVIEKILDHLGLPTEKPRALPARSPPEHEQLELDYVDPDIHAE